MTATKKWRGGKPRLSDLSPNIQTHIAECVSLLEALLTRRQVHFQGRTVNASDEGGIYVFSDRRTNELLYVGQTRKGIKSRLKDHWDGATSSDLAKRLVMEGVVANISEGRGWMVDNVAIRWMTVSDLETCLNWAEHFAIGALRPRFNK